MYVEGTDSNEPSGPNFFKMFARFPPKFHLKNCRLCLHFSVMDLEKKYKRPRRTYAKKGPVARPCTHPVGHERTGDINNWIPCLLIGDIFIYSRVTSAINLEKTLHSQVLQNLYLILTPFITKVKKQPFAILLSFNSTRQVVIFEVCGGHPSKLIKVKTLYKDFCLTSTTK